MDSDKGKGSPEEAEKLQSPTAVEKAAAPEPAEGEEAPEQSKLLTPTEVIKFIPAAGDSKNGDAKIDIDNGGRVAFSGMGKEELMKFANDPFWIRLRWFLFILFWAAWVAMLAGSIAIIFFAPKCPAPAPREWWEQGPIAPIDVQNFNAEGNDKSGTLEDVTSGLASLHKLGIKGLVLSSILQKDDVGIVDYKNVDSRLGTIEDFKKLTARAAEKGMKVMLTLTPNHSSDKHPWFIKSVNKEEPYTDYYVWRKGTRDAPPNNWLSKNGGSAWEWSAQRKEFFLHQFAKNQPEFDFRNPAVITAFKDVLSFWRGMGVSGFRLEDASYLLEDRELRNDTVAASGEQERGSTHTDYGFYRHIYTLNQPGNVDVLKKLKAPVLADEANKMVLAADIVGPPSDASAYYGPDPSEGSEEKRDLVVELPLFDLTLHLPQPPQRLAARQLQNTILKWLGAMPDNGTWPNWLIPDGLVVEELEGGFHMAMMLLPGTPLSSYGTQAPQNVPANSSEYEEQRAVMHGLSVARESPSILYGPLDLRVFQDDILAYTREKSGNPGYLVLLNVGDADREVDVTQFPDVPHEVSVQLRSPGFKDPSVQEKGKLQSSAVSVPAKSALVLTFVPQKH